MGNNKEIIFWAFALILVAVFAVRFLTPKDNWICKKGEWVKHGNPTEQMPERPCPKEIK